MFKRFLKRYVEKNKCNIFYKDICEKKKKCNIFYKDICEKKRNVIYFTKIFVTNIGLHLLFSFSFTKKVLLFRQKSYFHLDKANRSDNNFN